MNSETEYKLQEFRNEQSELFNSDGVAHDRLSHKEPMARMLDLINSLEKEILISTAFPISTSTDTAEELTREGVEHEALFYLSELVRTVSRVSNKFPDALTSDDLNRLTQSMVVLKKHPTDKSKIPVPQPVTGEGEVTAMTAMQELIEYLKPQKEDCLKSYTSTDVQGSEKLQAMYEGMNMAYGIAIAKATELLAKESEDKKNEAIAFAEWIELEGYRIKGMDDTQRANIYKQFKNGKTRDAGQFFKEDSY